MQTLTRLIVLASLLLIPLSVAAQDQQEYPGEVCVWFVNEDGSCVQCSISNCGVWQNDPRASTLLQNTKYGPRVRGGSSPSRVEAYADRRGIPLWNITGDTYPWMKWGAKTGRMMAIGCFSAHFQTLLWYNPDPADPKPWKVRNNWYNTTSINNEYTDAEFRRYHSNSGHWVVILKATPPPMLPTHVAWWELPVTDPLFQIRTRNDS
jgi:hypothetical protein